jgi:hypothetical protein
LRRSRRPTAIPSGTVSAAAARLPAAIFPYGVRRLRIPSRSAVQTAALCATPATAAIFSVLDRRSGRTRRSVFPTAFVVSM